MDHSLHRPQVFVRVEFGVSWSPQHSPRTRGLQYRSRGIRERSPNFPRQVAAPNTNYLAAVSIQQFQQQQAQQYAQSQQQLQQQQHQQHQQIQHRPVDRPQSSRPPHSQPPRERPEQRRSKSKQIEQLQDKGIFQESRRSSRSSKSSHERGRSAPPPLSDNNWDVISPGTSSRAMQGSSTAAATATRSASNLWKDLPEVPSRFRLGEDGMPWDSLSFPLGWDPYIEADDLLQEPSEHSFPYQDVPQPRRESPSTPEPPVRNPARVTFSMPTEEQHYRPYRQDDPERVRELEALGSAMMTIDNGFENQWWNQGERQPMPFTPVAGDLIVPVHPPPSSGDTFQDQLALGWQSYLPPGAMDERLSFSTANNIVSPVSSGGTDGYPRLSRSLSTRSEELWCDGRYA